MNCPIGVSVWQSPLRVVGEGWAVFFSVFLFLFSSSLHAQNFPTDIYPLDSAVVTNPPSFSWSPNGNADIYLNVSTSSTISVIDVVNWHDDGSHYFC